MSRHAACNLSSTSSSAKALATSAEALYGEILEHLFDTEHDGASHGDTAARGQNTPLPLRLAAVGGDPLHTESSATMLLHDLKREYGDIVVADTSLTGDSDAVSVAALVCARHAAANLNHELARMPSPERSDFVWQFVPGPDEDSAHRAFWDLLATKLYAYVTCFFPASWQSLAGLTDAPDWSMPVWRTPVGVVCDLFVYLTPWDDDLDIAAVAQRALDLAVASFGPEVVGVRVLPLFAPYLARWHFPDGTWTPLDDRTELPDALTACTSQPPVGGPGTGFGRAFEVAR